MLLVSPLRPFPNQTQYLLIQRLVHPKRQLTQAIEKRPEWSNESVLSGFDQDAERTGDRQTPFDRPPPATPFIHQQQPSSHFVREHNRFAFTST